MIICQAFGLAIPVVDNPPIAGGLTSHSCSVNPLSSSTFMIWCSVDHNPYKDLVLHFGAPSRTENPFDAQCHCDEVKNSSMKPLKTHHIATVKENETDKEMPNKSMFLPHNLYEMPSHRRYSIKPPSLNPGANTWWLDKKANSTLRVDWLIFNPLFPRNATEPMNHPPSRKGWCDESKVLQNLIVSMIVMTYVTTEPSKKFSHGMKFP